MHEGFAETVHLVGAGPGDPDLLTVKALRLIQTADVILHDDLVPQAILDLASPSAEIVNVGKRCGTKTITQGQINSTMIDYARQNRSVVRLKSGDPLIFGRAAEEIAALTEAGVPFQIVPGITAAFAAAASHWLLVDQQTRRIERDFFYGPSRAIAQRFAALPELEDATRVVYMPGRNLNLLAQEWLAAGPAAGVSLRGCFTRRSARPADSMHHSRRPWRRRTNSRSQPVDCRMGGKRDCRRASIGGGRCFCDCLRFRSLLSHPSLEKDDGWGTRLMS